MSSGPALVQNPPLIELGRRFLSAVGTWYNLVLFLIFMAGSLYVRPLFAATEGGDNALAGEVATKQQPIDLLQEGLEVAGYLLILMVFAAAVIRLGKRFQPRVGASGLIRVEDGHNLSPGVGVRLISVGSRAWLVGVTKERVSLLAEMSQEDMQTAKEGSA
ncbi:MAG: flagellar biosynthetic protein FliO [Magnetococcales bacterium]|nr:flagellar biosynthetic protein FliO [Magnetococcales bacterium]